MLTSVLVPLWQGQSNSFLFPGSAPSPVGMVSSIGVLPALGPRPRGPCQLIFASTCPSHRLCRAAGPGPVQGRGHSAWCPTRKPPLQARPQLPLLVLPRRGPSPGPVSCPQLRGLRASCPGPRKARRSPVKFLPSFHPGGSLAAGGVAEASPPGRPKTNSLWGPPGGRPVATALETLRCVQLGQRDGFGRLDSRLVLCFTGQGQAHFYHQGKVT